MFHPTSNIFLLYLVFTSVLTASSLSVSKTALPSFLSRTRMQNGPVTTQKPVTPANMIDKAEWKKVGSNYYIYSSGSDGNWNFGSRDTLIYDATGNWILRKESGSQSSWEQNILELDSCVYMNGKIAEYYHFIYNSEDKIDYAHRNIFTYSSDNNIFVSEISNWYSTTPKWVVENKDSIILSSPVNISNYYFFEILPQLKIYYSYGFNSANSTWNLAACYTRIDEESTNSKLVINSHVIDYNSTIYDSKWIYTFESPNWDYWLNNIELRFQVKDTITGKYIDLSRDLHFNDSYGNDTLTISYSFNRNTSTWDTTQIYRTTLSYDFNGNNTVAIGSRYIINDKRWQILSKTETVFAPINVPVVRLKGALLNEVSMLNTPWCVRFSGPEITSLNVYNSAGVKVVSIKQDQSNSISLDLRIWNSRISSGVFFAEVTSQKGKTTFPLVVKK